MSTGCLFNKRRLVKKVYRIVSILGINARGARFISSFPSVFESEIDESERSVVSKFKRKNI